MLLLLVLVVVVAVLTQIILIPPLLQDYICAQWHIPIFAAGITVYRVMWCFTLADVDKVALSLAAHSLCEKVPMIYVFAQHSGH